MSLRRTTELTLAALALAMTLVMVAACSSETDDTNRRTNFGGVKSGAVHVPEDDGRRCPSDEGLLEESLDTSGDNVADVRKVWRVEGDGQKSRKILVCRELDLNQDGRKDIFRFYNEEGRPLRELTDDDFDGQIDSVAFFENGRIVRQEFDRNGDGREDETRYFLRGKLQRVERDDNHDGEIDVWEHWHKGRLLRIGYDVNADQVADYWHRAPPSEDDEERARAPVEEDMEETPPE